MLPAQRPRYASYLLRLWQEDPASLWRATLEEVHTGRRLHFGSPEALFDYLERRLRVISGSAPDAE